jgi:predicted enzyme related to lactoylglutathione lyase
MVERTSYAPGTPCWVDLATTDLEGSIAFYTRLFGWTAHRSGDPATGGYTICQLRDRAVAGLMPTGGQTGAPPAWLTYVSVVDADATVARAVAAGATLIAGPMDIVDVGRAAMLADPVGATFAVWQPRAHVGAGLVDEPGALAWNELTVRDVDAVRPWYAELFGWSGEPHAFFDGTYTEWHLDGRDVAGLIEITDSWPPEVPNHWMTYFAVADCDDAVARAAGLGAEVLVPPTDIPLGRFSVLRDPQGAVFSVLRLDPARVPPD